MRQLLFPSFEALLLLNQAAMKSYKDTQRNKKVRPKYKVVKEV